ncbi:FAD/NAD(P)-binding domain-containing protein, partial [Corynespora cassiicola Philippines]
MARSFLLSTALLALRATAQSATPYTDDKSGITFNGYQHTSGFKFGLALPENPTTDFIAQIVGPVTEGWAGFSVGSSMRNNLIVVAWPNEGEVVSSFRKATGYTSPPVVEGDFTMSTIPDGTYVNDTAFSYTFLCKNCIGTDALQLSDTNNVFGWAMADTAVTDPTSASSALSYHQAGFGAFGVQAANAKSAEFDAWSALAVEGSGSGSTPGGNSTTPIAGGKNTTAIVSNSTYDYIVAGAGPAGIIVAQRLVESGASVLLLERGGASLAFTGNNDTMSWNSSVSMYDVPGYAYYLSQVGSPAFCTDTADQAGCLLGGGTMVNALMFVRPQEKDFDAKWPAGWKWADVAAAADRLYERNPGQTYGSEDGVRYDDGAYTVLSQFLSANGFQETDSIEKPNDKLDFYSRPAWSLANGMRSGPVRTYLPLAQAESNFKLELNTKVIRAVREGSAITGVEVETSAGQRVIYNVNQGGSVILSAGAMSTPRILFNSGIGPAEQLQTVASGSSGVTLPDEADWIDLPVGAEIKDHIIFTVKFNTSTSMSATPATEYTTPNDTTVDLFDRGSGLLAQSGQRLNFWTAVNTTDGNQVYVQATCNGPAENQVQMKIYLTHGLTSVGSLGITADGATTLTKEPWLTTDTDIEAATSFMDRLLKMASGSNSTLTVSGGNVTGADLIKEYKTGAHFVGTAKMGTKGDAGVVVDTDTKVYGTDNLFVVDASMHPDLPTGNTQAIVMVAAEAAAARIL